MYINMISKVLQPTFHGKITHRPCDEVCRQYPQSKSLGQKQCDTRNGGAQDFSNTDLFGFSVCRERCQTEQSKAGNNYGQYREKFPDAPLANDEFTKRGVDGKNKDLFFKQDLPIKEEGIYIDPNLVV